MTFDQWLDDKNNNPLYSNKDILVQIWPNSYFTSVAWLEQAYQVGYNAGKNDEPIWEIS